MSGPEADDGLESKKLALAYATDNRKSEIALLWSRSLYFWGFISVILISYGSALQSGRQTLALLAACFGFLCSLCWTLVNRSGKYWQQVWEIKVEEREKGLFEKPLFPRTSNPVVTERWFWGAKQYSPSKLAMAISDLTMAVWIALIAATVLPEAFHFTALVRIAVIIATVLYALAVLIWCRSGSPMTLAQAWDLIRQKKF